MLPHPTLERLTGMGFAGMARAFAELATNAEADRLTHAEWRNCSRGWLRGVAGTAGI